jgi:hypothetical protein
MGNLLVRTMSGIEDCERHLASSGGLGTEIESYLTQYLLVVLCADIQQEIYRLSEKRALAANDAALSSYVSSSAPLVLRSVSKSDIAKFVGYFGVECKDKLNSSIDDADVTVFNNAVISRHNVAHKHGTNISFRELKEAASVAVKILEATARSLGVT